MEFHDVVFIWPNMQPDEFAKLVADIKENGLREPIWRYEGKIIDGKNRYLACEEAGVEPRYQDWGGHGSLILFVASLNQHRRHLDASQRAMIAVRIETELAKEAKQNMSLGGGDKKSEAAKSPLEIFPNPIQPIHAAKEAAKVTGTNHHYVTDAKRVVNQAPELEPLVMDRVISLLDAKKLANEEKEIREAITQKITSGEAKNVKEAKKVVKQEERSKIDIMNSPGGDSPEIEVEHGQVWKLGIHRLYCGDSSSETFRILARESYPSLAFADPPYNAGVADWDENFLWQHDYLSDIAPIVAVTPGISAIKDFMQRTDMPYKWSMSYWLSNGMTRGAIGFGNWIYVALFARTSIYRNGQDFEDIEWAPKERERLEASITNNDNRISHKGRKPLQMMTHIIKLFTEKGQVVVDPFLGSGTTLFVCEKNERKCVGAELSPEYCKEIIGTWEQESNQKAEVVHGANALLV